jgi:hypothetical protein
MTLPADLWAELRAAFPGADVDALGAELARYGSEAHEREVERVRRAIVALCAGDATRVAGLVDAAKLDYRDVLLWHDEGPMDPEQAADAAARAGWMLERWGKR